MAGSREEEKGCVTRRLLLLCALALLAGCESLNDTLVRQMYIDHGVSREVGDQIREGLERRQKAPAAKLPRKPAPPFLDLG
ncbi:hypothetical protein [Citrifermentans bremense]|uniref:hypothetical protein n=1 Tax=Citrifermentans bremense TaxID=60035 RepID=UPI0004264B2A|nr:hypothetical protein [Citrifermentans bremense]